MVHGCGLETSTPQTQATSSVWQLMARRWFLPLESCLSSLAPLPLQVQDPRKYFESPFLPFLNISQGLWGKGNVVLYWAKRLFPDVAPLYLAFVSFWVFSDVKVHRRPALLVISIMKTKSLINALCLRLIQHLVAMVDLVKANRKHLSASLGTLTLSIRVLCYGSTSMSGA